MTGQVTSEQLEQVPEQHRVLIARWLYERAMTVMPSFVLSIESAYAIKDVLAGVAIDLADPVAEDSTTEHAAATLAKILGRIEVELRPPADFLDDSPPAVVVRHVPPHHFRATGGIDG